MKHWTTVPATLLALASLSSCSVGTSEESAGGSETHSNVATTKSPGVTSDSGKASWFGEWLPSDGNLGDSMVASFMSKHGTKFRKTDGLPSPSVGWPMETFVSESVRSDGAYVERLGDGTSSVGFRDVWFSYGKEWKVLAYGKNWVKPAVEALSASGISDADKEAVREKFSSAYAKSAGFRTGDSQWKDSPVWKTVAEALAAEARR